MVQSNILNQISETRSRLVGSTLRVTRPCALRRSSGRFPQSECVKFAGLDRLDLYVQFGALARVVPRAHHVPGRELEVGVPKNLGLKHVGGRKVLTFTKLHPKMVRDSPEMINRGAPEKPRIKIMRTKGYIRGIREDKRGCQEAGWWVTS